MARPTRNEPGVPFRALRGRGLDADEIELGSIVGVFGVRGEVRLFLHNRESDLLSEPREVVLIDPSDRRWSASLRARSGAGKRILGHLEGLADRNVAGSLKGWRIAVAKDALPVVAEGEFYYWQLEGADVFVGDERVGEVLAIHGTQAGHETLDVFEVRALDGESRFVPSVGDAVVEMDPDAKRVVLTPEAWELA